VGHSRSGNTRDSNLRVPKGTHPKQTHTHTHAATHRVLNVHDLERSLVLLAVHDRADAPVVVAADRHDHVADVELEEWSGQQTCSRGVGHRTKRIRRAGHVHTHAWATRHAQTVGLFLAADPYHQVASQPVPVGYLA
jgi:hypothetical protein